MRVVRIVLSYLAVVVWLTWPLGAHAFTHLPCTGIACILDTLYSTWVLAYESHALATSPLRLTDGNIYHPAPSTVFYGPAGFGALPYFAPVYALSGSAAFAMNATFVLCVALTAGALHLVVLRWTGRHAAGAAAAATLLTNRWLLWGFVGTAPHLAALQYFPLIVFLAAVPREGVVWLLALLALVVLQCLTDPVYVAPAVLGPLGLLGLFRLSRRASRREGARLALVLVAAVVLLSPIYLGYLQLRESNPDLATQTPWQGREWRLDLTSLFRKGLRPTTVAPAALALALAGAAIALLRLGVRRKDASAGEVDLPAATAWRHAALWALAGTMLSIPPRVTWGARTLFVPQALLDQWTPFYDVIRGPSRLGVAGLMGLCLLAGLGYAEIAGLVARVGRGLLGRGLQVALAVAVLALVYSIPPRGAPPLPDRFPLRRTPQVPAAFQPILVRGHEPLVVIPALTRGEASPTPRNASAMFQSISHWRPILNGYSSYWPAGFVERMQLAERLPDRSALIELVRASGVGLVWVDLRGYPQAEQRRWARVSRAPGRSGLTLLARGDRQMLFAVTLSGARSEAAGAPFRRTQR